MEWIKQVFESSEFGIAILPASLLLGLLTAFSSCCNIGIIAAIAGYAGSRDESFRRKDAVITSISFLIGTVVSLALLGLLVGYFGKFAGQSFGRYGVILIGFMAILMGLITLNLIPIKLPTLNLSGKRMKGGVVGATLFGLLVGMASITCTVACSGPLLPFVLGVAGARGQGGWGALILTMFAIGYSLPLAGIMLGVGMGRVTSFAQKAIKPIRIIAGIALIIVGFWLIITLK
jgi:cytochrome c-type biogenesis protein